MASHCHGPTTSSGCCCCSTSSHHPPPPHQPIIHCQSIHPTPHPQSHLISPPCSSFNPQTHHQQQETQYFYYPPQTHKQKSQSHRYHHQYHQEEEEQQHINPTIISLLRRISAPALESSIFNHSSTSFPLRNAAARTIQTHFRAFLVRRSRALRQLKDLAFIKSALNTLKYNHSNNTHCDSRALSHKAMDLLNKLDSIQSGDPMIRDSKRSISRELIRFMDYLDDLSMKRHQLLSRVVKNVKLGGTGTKSRVFQSDQRTSIADCRGLEGEEGELLEKLRKRVEKIEGFSGVYEEDQEKDVELENPRTYTNGKPAVLIRTGILKKRHAGVQAKAKKNVNFADNGNAYMVYRSSNWPNPNGECNSIDGSDSIDGEELGREVEEIGTGDDEEEVHTDDNESPQISDDDRDPRSDLIENDDGSFVFSAPLPVKMEPRADMRSKKKSVKILN